MGFLLKGADAKKYSQLIEAGHTEHCAYDMVFFNQGCLERCLFKPAPAQTHAERQQKYIEAHPKLKSDKPKGRPRKFQTNAERQRAYRLRQKPRPESLDATTHTGSTSLKVLLQCGPDPGDNVVRENTK